MLDVGRKRLGRGGRSENKGVNSKFQDPYHD